MCIGNNYFPIVVFRGWGDGNGGSGGGGGGGGGSCGNSGGGRGCGSCVSGGVSVKSLKEGCFLHQSDAKLPRNPFPAF